MILCLVINICYSWDLDNWKTPWRGHNGTIRVLKFRSTSLNGFCDYDTSNEILVSGGAGDFRPRIWDVKTGK